MNLTDLIAIDTQNPNAKGGNTDYSKLVKLLSVVLKNNGAGVSLVSGNLLATWGTPKLLLNAHMDTVQAGKGSVDGAAAIISQVAKDKTFGLGSSDNKGNVYCIIKAIETTNPKNLAVLFSVDEEFGKVSGVSNFVKVRKSITPAIDKVIVMEPTENELVTRHPGYYSFWVVFRTIARHSSLNSSRKKKEKHATPQNAIVNAALAIIKLRKYGFNIGKIQSENPAANTIASECSIKISIRTYDSHKIVLSKLKSIPELNLGKITPSFIGLPFVNKKPFLSLPNSNAATNSEVGFWSEASIFAAVGINTILYGAGSIKQAHSPDEYVEHASLGRCVKFLQNTITKHSI